MIETLTYIGLIIYIAGFLILLGGGLSHEHGNSDPEYSEAAVIAGFWPLLLIVWVFARYFHD